MPEMEYALSIKQPWATLLLHGLKSIEIRRWATARRGRILIHAARVPDASATAWAAVPRALRGAAEVVGGLVGSCEVVDCIPYRTPEAFAADQPRHLNDPAWFAPPVLYGFVMTHPKPMPFRPYPGWVRFFPIKENPPLRRRKPRPASASHPSLFPDTSE